MFYGNATTYMCKKFDIPSVYTESDNEEDAPTCYEQLFNTPVSARLNYSPTYSSVWDVYKNVEGSFSNNVTNISNGTSYATYLQQNFLLANNVEGLNDFNRSDYYRFDIAVDDIVHNRSVLAVQDMINDIPNTMHAPFNCILFCVNSAFNAATSNASNGTPAGMNNAVPICMSCNTETMMLVGSAITIEPSINGIITVE